MEQTGPYYSTCAKGARHILVPPQQVEAPGYDWCGD